MDFDEKYMNEYVSSDEDQPVEDLQDDGSEYEFNMS